MTANGIDAWLRTVKDISNGADAARKKEPKGARRAARCWDGRSQPIVRVLDKPTMRTLTVSWCDARTGHYGYRTWRVRCARKPGRCVLTGNSIEAGDMVFSPRRGSPPPGNAGAMIAVASLRFASER